MGVIRVAERWEGRGATTDEKGVRTLKRQWTVETDSDSTAEPAVVDAVVAFDASAGLYASHPAWLPALCRSLTAAPFGGPRVWVVDAAYSSAPFEAKGDGSGEGEGNTSSPSPAQSNQTPADQRPPTIAISRKEVTEPLEDDILTHTPVLNTVGDPFDPVPEVFRSHHLITFKFHRTYAQLNWATRSLFMDSINEAAFTVLGREYEAHSLRVVDYSLDTVWDTGAGGMSLFFALTCQCEYNPDLWDVRILNTGRRKNVGGSIGDPDNPPKLVPIVDASGQPVADPVPLNIDGTVHVPGTPYTYVEPAGYIPKSFTGLLA